MKTMIVGICLLILAVLGLMAIIVKGGWNFACRLAEIDDDYGTPKDDAPIID